jgi:NAD(P)-dependent dehydrogenase (short-subunit alcohol dehydrogenase family)
MGKLDGKVAIVTGSGRGIGAEIALKLAADGAAVMVNDLDEQPAKETVAAIEKAVALPYCLGVALAFVDQSRAFPGACWMTTATGRAPGAVNSWSRNVAGCRRPRSMANIWSSATRSRRAAASASSTLTRPARRPPSPACRGS